MTSSPATLPMGLRRDGASAPRPARWFYVGMAVASLVTVFSGFARSFYLRPLSTMPTLAPLVVAHGILFTSWIALFFAQTALVATGQSALHRRLGLATAGLSAVMVVSGPWMALGAARRGALPADPLAFLLVILVDMIAFAVFVAAAVLNRRRSEPHKRLMLLAMVSLLPPAVSRWPIAVRHPLVILGVLVLFLAAAPAYDLMARRHIHPISLWGGLALLASIPLRFAVSRTEAWHRAASWLLR